jgi:hypothetical protein
MRLIPRRFPTLVGVAPENDGEPKRTQASKPESGVNSRICFWLGDFEPGLDQFWAATRLSTIEIASLGLLLVIGPEHLQDFNDRRAFVLWDGEIDRAPYSPGVALELRPTAAPAVEAERVRRIISWAPRQFVEAGRSAVPEFLVYGDPRAMRELPRGLADIALVDADNLIPEDLQIGRGTVLAAKKPFQTRPAWAGLPVLVGPELFWWAPWMADLRTQTR